MLLSPANKHGNSFDFYLQKSIARWEPSLKEVPFTNNLKLVPLASENMINPAVRKLFNKEIPNAAGTGRLTWKKFH